MPLLATATVRRTVKRRLSEVLLACMHKDWRGTRALGKQKPMRGKTG